MLTAILAAMIGSAAYKDVTVLNRTYRDLWYYSGSNFIVVNCDSEGILGCPARIAELRDVQEHCPQIHIGIWKVPAEEVPEEQFDYLPGQRRVHHIDPETFAVEHCDAPMPREPTPLTDEEYAAWQESSRAVIVNCFPGDCAEAHTRIKELILECPGTKIGLAIESPFGEPRNTIEYIVDGQKYEMNPEHYIRRHCE